MRIITLLLSAASTMWTEICSVVSVLHYEHLIPFFTLSAAWAIDAEWKCG